MKTIDPADDYLSPRQAAELIGCSKQTVLAHVRAGALAAVLVAGRWLIRRRDAAKFPAPPRGRPAKTKDKR